MKWYLPSYQLGKCCNIDVISWDPRGADMGMEICKWVAYCGVSAGTGLIRE